MSSTAYSINYLKQHYPDKTILEALAVSIDRDISSFEKIREKYKDGKHPSFGLTEDIYTNALKIIGWLRRIEKMPLGAIPKKGKFEKYDVVLAELADWLLTENKRLNGRIGINLIGKLNELSAKISSSKAICKDLIERNENAPAEYKTYSEKQIIRDVWDKRYNEARQIFKEAAEQNIIFSAVPAGGDSLRDFQVLQGWVDDSLCKVSVPETTTEQNSSIAKDDNESAEKILRNIANNVANALLINRTKFERYKDDFHKRWTKFQTAIQKAKLKQEEILSLDPTRKLRTGINAILPQTPEEQLWRSYVWMIIVHDSLLKSNVPIDNSKVKPLRDLYGIIQSIITDTGEIHPVLKRENQSGIFYIEAAFEAVKADLNSNPPVQETPPNQDDKDKKEQKNILPLDSIKLCVVIKEFNVSRATLERQINAGNIQSYRPVAAAKNSPHLISKTDVARLYPKR